MPAHNSGYAHCLLQPGVRAGRPVGKAVLMPAILSERKDAYLITVELPGIKPEDL